MNHAVTAERYPVPPEDLRWRSTGVRDVDDFLRSGRACAEFFDKDALGREGKSFRDFNSILDFGCGSGRLARALRPLCDPWATIQGVDVDQAAIEWCRQNIPDAGFSVNDEYPPLPFADQSIDLVLACSVFTHLDAEHQFRWLGELQRIVKPDGYLLLTFRHKPAEQIADEGARQRIVADLYREGFAFAPAGQRDGVFASWLGEACHSPDYVRKNWGSYFEVRQIISAGAVAQDTAVLRARESTFMQRLFRRP